MTDVGRQALIYGAGVFLTKGTSFLMLPVYTRFLTPADYGVMELIGMTLDVLAIVAGAKLALGIFRYYHGAETAEARSQVVSTALIALSVSYGTVGAGALLFADPLSRLVFGSATNGELIRIAAVTLGLQSLMIVPFAYLRVRNRAVWFVTANLAKLALSVALVLLFLVHMEMGVRGVFLATLVSTATVGVIMGGIVIREVGLRFSIPAVRDLARYGIPLIGVQIAAFVLTFGDRYFLQAVADPWAVGLYALAYQFGFLLAAVGYAPFEAVWEPARFTIAKRESRAERDILFAKGFLYVNVVLVTMAVGISLFVADLLRIMATPAFHPAAELVPVILVAYLLQGWTQVQDTGIHLRGRTEFLTLANWIAALVALAGYAMLVPRFFGMGAALATVLAFLVRYVVVYTTSQRLWPIRYAWGPVVRLVSLAGFVVAGSRILPEAALPVSLMRGALLFVAYLLALWSLGILSRSDREYLLDLSRLRARSAASTGGLR
jgi:O-antigen/teichoic acid export membrane protein